MAKLTLGISLGIVDGVQSVIVAMPLHPEPIDKELIAKKSGKPFTITEACSGYYNHEMPIDGEVFKLTAQVQRFKNDKMPAGVVQLDEEVSID